MKKLVKNQIRFFIGSVLFTIFASLAAVFVQFLKGEILDFALDRNSNQAFIYGGFLLFMIAS